ncbi:MAG: hypothetical protein PW790_10890 [Parvibaculaceae bacterium]|nr:hypothetical protein [Parvibaculaceae bacterium]
MVSRQAVNALVLVLLSGLGGCVTRHYTTFQELSVATKPNGARCDLAQGDYKLSFRTPATVRIQKSDDDIAISCRQGEFMIGSTTLTPSKGAMDRLDVLQGVPQRAFYNYDAMVTIPLTEEPAKVDAAPTDAVTIEAEPGSVAGAKPVVLPPMLPKKKGSLETFMGSAPARKSPAAAPAVKPASVTPAKPAAAKIRTLKSTPAAPKASMAPIPD